MANRQGPIAMPPLAMLGLLAGLLREVPLDALINALAPALLEMVEIIEEDVEGFFEMADGFSFPAWLDSFEISPDEDNQADVWDPLVIAFSNLPGGVDLEVLRKQIEGTGRYGAILLWLAVNLVFFRWENEQFEEQEIDPENAWLTELIPVGWDGWYHDDEPDNDGLIIVLSHLYTQAAQNWSGQWQPAAIDRDFAMEFFLLPGWKKTRDLWRQARMIEADIESNYWAQWNRLERDGQISWRDALAEQLKDVECAEVCASLEALLQEHSETILAKLADEPERTKISFDTWLVAWSEPFRKEDDPVRDMLADFASAVGVELISLSGHMMDGLVLLDWLLAVHEAWNDEQVQCGMTMPEIDHVRLPEQRHIEWHVRDEYRRFCEHNGRDEEAPAEFNLSANFDRLYL